MQTLSILGCGKVGKTLGRRWSQAKTFELGQLMTCSAETADAAVAFVGAGRPLTNLAELEPADALLLSVPDDDLAPLAQQLATLGKITKGTVCWHASGAIPFSVLQPLQQHGAEIGSMHAIKSFADPEIAAETFPGTPCVVEGSEEACELITEAVKAIGGVPMTLKMSNRGKSVYHAGTTLASNGVVALFEVALQCLQQSGMSREQAAQLLQPLLAGTVENIAKLGTVGALTGPISRGEVGTVARHLAALDGAKATIIQAYRLLGQLTIDVAKQQAHANEEALDTIQNLLHISS